MKHDNDFYVTAFILTLGNALVGCCRTLNVMEISHFYTYKNIRIEKYIYGYLIFYGYVVYIGLKKENVNSLM